MNPSLVTSKSQTETTGCFWLLLQVMFRAKHRMMDMAEKHDLTMMQAMVLGLLEPGSPRPMNTLSEKLDCDASNVTGLVDRLEKRGAIARQDDPDDRRVKMIVLTKAGEALRSAIIDELAAGEEARMAQVLSPTECKSFCDMLKRINDR